mmetsp:Transcript_6560/g.9910  ORF Transcript_6560/g.9910 Transcript_6560/m.9910 type:complete len:115 (+) Transcript_6560:103-447(+)|eukprot:CAMPEP_0185042202 /NCGR_PEP_ID=MMETSP1103-20130426/42213_1 /TAXON_ID=36769 /ORGANISM="Paraphysomonas bandaiensis, Strain Caron Lab Isolate" /LENGTH=114 /DNA_ID=CAMNT_0027582229 /DNA_START=84 /DNA_END=428 /DNA_ORIENTATION=+
MPSEGYDPNRSTIGPEGLSNFIQNTVTGDITEVPGIGPKAKEALAKKGITTTFQLFGQFLMLKEDGVGSVEHCDRFWYWLNSCGISSHRAGIVQCIAEKVDTMFPGVYDASMYE